MCQCVRYSCRSLVEKRDNVYVSNMDMGIAVEPAKDFGDNTL